MAAAKRLFRDVEDLSRECEEARNQRGSGSGTGVRAAKQSTRSGTTGVFLDGLNDDDDDDDVSVSAESSAKGRETSRASIWAGRRLVRDWGSFLQGCEREGVAPV